MIHIFSLPSSYIATPEALYRELFIHAKSIYNLPPDVTFLLKKNCYGKPFFSNYKYINFSISHTDKYSLFALSNSKIGIDIEKKENIDYKLISRFYTKPEQDCVFSSTNPTNMFYDIWTRKEAYTKWLGTGLSTPLNSFDTFSTDINQILLTRSFRCYSFSICHEYLSTAAINFHFDLNILS